MEYAYLLIACSKHAVYDLFIIIMLLGERNLHPYADFGIPVQQINRSNEITLA